MANKWISHKSLVWRGMFTVLAWLAGSFWLGPRALAVTGSVEDAIKHGTTPPPTDSGPVMSTGGSIGTLIEFVVALGVIVAAAYLTIRFLAQRTQGKSTGRGKTILTHGLAQGRSLHVIELGGIVLLLGVGETVTLLKEISDPDAVQLFLARMGDPSIELAGEMKQDPRTPFAFENELQSRIEALRQTASRRESTDGSEAET